MIHFIDLQSQYQAYKGEILKEIDDVLSSSAYILGPKVDLLEKQLAAFVGTPYAVTCGSGSDALMLALMALDIKAGDEVIVPAFTFIATAEMVSLLGAEPVFADVLPDSFCLDPVHAEALITDKTKAIIPVSLFGQIGPMDSYENLAKKYSLHLIEDGAQSFGAEQNGRKSLSFGDVGTASFFPAKPLGAYGEGGALFTGNEGIYKKLLSLRNHGQSQRYLHHDIGFNGRLDAMQAAVLLVKLRHFEEEMDTRQRVARNYFEGLSGVEQIRLPQIAEGNLSAYAQFTVCVKNRESLLASFQEKGIPLAVHYPIPLYDQPVYSGCRANREDFPVSARISQEVVSLPFSAFLKEEDQNIIIENLIKWTKE